MFDEDRDTLAFGATGVVRLIDSSILLIGASEVLEIGSEIGERIRFFDDVLRTIGRNGVRCHWLRCGFAHRTCERVASEALEVS